MSQQIDRKARCPCGSGKKYKRCHGAAAVGAGGKAMGQGTGPSVTIPKTKLGLPGASYQLHVHGGKKGQTAPTLTVVLQDNYRVVLTLARTVAESQGFTFEAGLMVRANVNTTR